MVKTLTVTCPHCHQISQIYLSTNACVIILNCPSCFTPIMYFDHKIFPLTRNQVEAIKNTSQDSAVMRMLQRIANTEQPIRNTAKKVAHQCSSNAVEGIPPITLTCPKPSDREKYISDDDITNLRIELETCNTIEQFIDRM